MSIYGKYDNESLAVELYAVAQIEQNSYRGALMREAGDRLRAMDGRKDKSDYAPSPELTSAIMEGIKAKREAMDRAGECYSDGSEGCTASDRRVETMPVYGGYSNAEIMERIGELERHIKNLRDNAIIVRRD